MQERLQLRAVVSTLQNVRSFAITLELVTLKKAHYKQKRQSLFAWNLPFPNLTPNLWSSWYDQL